MREEISLSMERHSSTSAHRYGSRITDSQNCDSPEITIEFHSFLLSHQPPSLFPVFPPSPASPVVSFSFSLSDGSITGAMLRELLQPSLSGCVSSNVRVELSNLLTMQEKGKREGGKKVSPVPK